MTLLMCCFMDSSLSSRTPWSRTTAEHGTTDEPTESDRDVHVTFCSDCIVCQTRKTPSTGQTDRETNGRTSDRCIDHAPLQARGVDKQMGEIF